MRRSAHGRLHPRALHPSHLLLARTLNHLLPFHRRGILPTLAQHLPALGRQLFEPAEVLANRILLVGGQRLKTLPAVAKGAALIGRQRVPALEALLGLAALFR